MHELTGVARRARATGRMLVIAVGATAITLAAIGSAVAAPPAVALGTAVVDGNVVEWGPADQFGDLFVYGNRADVRGTVYARFDCDDETLYIYVMATDGQLRADEPNEAWVRIDDADRSVRGDAGNDGVPPDFAWVGVDDVNATGFEASMPMAPGNHTMFLHVHQWWDDEDLAVSLVIVRDTPIVATCPDTTPEVTPAATPEVTPTPTPSGTVAAATGTPTPTPSGMVAAATGTPAPTPSGMVAAATGTPDPTLPPTDTGAISGSSPSGSSWQLLLLAMAGLLATVLLLTPAKPATAARKR